MRYIVYTFFIILLFSGCSRQLPAIDNTPQPQIISEVQKAQKETASNGPAKPSKISDLQMLYNQYKKWKGTPYKYGGLSLNGVDCSGFVHNSYKKVYGITLPRTTDDQVKEGRRVYLYELITGDLLFFNTGWNVKHVGIYLEKGKFMHASSSNGVMISSVNSAYWKEHYWQSRRLF